MASCFVCCQEQSPPGADVTAVVARPQMLGLSMETSSLGSAQVQEEPSEPSELLDSAQREHVKLPSEDSHMKEEVTGQITEQVVTTALASDEKIATVTTSLENQDILRVTSIRNVMRRGGSILRNSSGSAETYLLSESRDWVDIFISHNWAVPRWKKFWALALYFNIVHAMVAAYLGVAIGCVLNVLSIPPVFRTSEGPMGSHCMIFGSVGFFLAVVLGHDLPLVERLFGRQQVFLDKICIHQTDPDLKAAGVHSLGAFLRYSSKMLVLFNRVYCKKLWTVYEAACYMYLHRWTKLELLPVDIASVVLKSTALVTMIHFFSVVVVSVALSYSMDTGIPQAVTTLLGSFLIIVLARIFRNWALQLKDLYSDLRSFEFARAQCTDESDRAVISSNICAFVRSMGLVRVETSDEEALMAFNKLVQDQMPELLRSAIGHAGFPYKYALVAGIGHDFYTFDEISSMQDPSGLQVMARLVNGFVVRAAVLPSMFLVCSILSNTCKPRQGLAEFVVKCTISATAVLVTLSLLYAATVCRGQSEKSVWWLTGFAVVGVVLTLVVARLFSWRPSAGATAMPLSPRDDQCALPDAV